MSQLHSVPDDLDEFLEGPEPDWDAPPEAPRDVKQVGGLMRRLRRVVRLRAETVAKAQERIGQIQAWVAERDAGLGEEEDWLRASLAAYHEGVIAQSPNPDEALTLYLPEGDLTSRRGPREWIVTDEKTLTRWLIPPDVRDAVDAARERYEAEVEALLVASPCPEAVKAKGPPLPELSKSGLIAACTRRNEKGDAVAWGLTPKGDRPPGLVVKPGERNYDVTFRDEESD